MTFGMRRIAILADFPLHLVPGSGVTKPGGHYATWLPQLAESFADQREFKIDWLTVCRTAAKAPPVEWLGQTFHRVAVPGKLRALRGYRRDRKEIVRLLRELKPDLTHSWGTEDCYGLAAADWGGPFVLSMQGILSEYVRRAPMHPLVHLQAWYERRVFARVRALTCESLWGLELMKTFCPAARTWQVEYGVSRHFYDVPWQPDPSLPTAVFVGTADARKGLEDAVRAFSSPRLSGTRLEILGDTGNAMARRLMKVSTQNVFWLGRLSREETASTIGRAWCLVLPTRADTSPNVVKEARVIGLPVITTPCGGQADYVKDGKNGWIVPPGDVTLLTERLASVLSDIGTTRTFGAWEHEAQRAWFRPEQTGARFLQAYRELLAE
jgi:glycosyltransferase involved in cell wall biosynthesis